ncbi:hypothetical protein HDF26_001105 [Pedobacter cryoconitis]|uniref:DUF1572 domain-containing protein n=1 Tax=Pedobacter cryoconitis TaxID=188932 RepID=A0A7W8ZR53_9SPHI|nr:DUF1572 domain-containing protein [Pedobacter cryoconitis]MBB5638490.1 hypothetical protein [Pedobacter cryoconitis]MBB6270678.1 hypothetical protein [Pedobacter cryoconitis]
MMNLEDIKGVIKQFEYYRMLGEKTFNQLKEEDLFWRYNEDSNSIAIIVNHLYGNMLSRWTDFLNTDGEKSWRNRDQEFDEAITDKETLLLKWNEGWDCLLGALNALDEADLDKIVYIRNDGHTITDAINRQLAHYPYHIGQIVFIGKMLANNNWQSLSIPKGNSQKYNEEKFAKEKEKNHFTDEFLKDKKDSGKLGQDV